MNYPLEDVKVLDFSRVLAGPYAGRMLSDLGADVVKIEAPDGDLTRNFGHVNGETSGYFIQQNIGKKNVCIDLKAEGAKELIYQLVEVADVVLENFRPGVMDRLGIGWDDLSKINPKLVMLSISGYGQVGPETHRAAYAPMLHAESGLSRRQGAVSDRPVGYLAINVADTFSGLHGLVGLLSALWYADKSGKGQHVDIGMIDVIHSTDDCANFHLDDVWTTGRITDDWEAWDAPEGKKIAISSPRKYLWHVVSTIGGVKDPTPKGAELAVKIENRFQAIQGHLLSFDSFTDMGDWLQKLGVAWGQMREPGEDAYASPSVRARGILVDVEDDTGASRRTVQSPYKFSNASSGITSQDRTAVRGESNYSTLESWLGLKSAEVDELISEGVVSLPDDVEFGY